MIQMMKAKKCYLQLKKHSSDPNEKPEDMRNEKQKEEQVIINMEDSTIKFYNELHPYLQEVLKKCVRNNEEKAFNDVVSQLVGAPRETMEISSLKRIIQSTLAPHINISHCNKVQNVIQLYWPIIIIHVIFVLFTVFATMESINIKENFWYYPTQYTGVYCAIWTLKGVNKKLKKI